MTDAYAFQVIVPASHKANMSGHIPALDSRVVKNPAGHAGDLLVFTVCPPALKKTREFWGGVDDLRNQRRERWSLP